MTNHKQSTIRKFLETPSANCPKKIIKILSKITEPFLLDEFFVTIKENVQTSVGICNQLVLTPIDQNTHANKSLHINIYEDDQYSYHFCTERNNWKPEALFDYPHTLAKWLNAWVWMSKNENLMPK